MAWWENPVTVPFNTAGYDVGYGGAHDMDVSAAPNTPVTALLPGTVSSISSPAWGMQVGIALDNPFNAAPYMAYLHLAAVNPALSVGSHVGIGDIIGWSGGANYAWQYAGTSNPTGRNFTNPISQSSQPQIGIALMRGPEYGVGAGWTSAPDPALNPTPLLDQLKAGKIPTSGGSTLLSSGISLPGWLSDPARILKILAGLGLIGLALYMLFQPDAEKVVAQATKLSEVAA